MSSTRYVPVVRIAITCSEFLGAGLLVEVPFDPVLETSDALKTARSRRPRTAATISARQSSPAIEASPFEHYTSFEIQRS